jgi:hypothetical protein
MRLETLGLGELNLDRCIGGYSDVLPLNIVSSGSSTGHDLIIWMGHFPGFRHLCFGGGSKRAVDGDS